MSVAQELTVLDKIRTRGHWRVVIRPTTFDAKHIADPSELFPIVERNSVQLRGWDYPHIDHQSPPLRGPDWVGQEYDRIEDEIEVWRLYTTGQFVHYFAIAGEWRDRSRTWPAEPGWEPGRHMYYVQTLYSFVEIFEFAARLALSPAGAALMQVNIDLRKLEGRQLVEIDRRIRFSRPYVTSLPEWNYRRQGTQAELIARPREFAAEAARELIAQFGLDVSLETVTRIQGMIGR
jgi:hypothetical protein